MADRIAPIRLGTAVCFDDRWQGHISSLEADENWDVLNIGVTSGFLFSSKTVRLPFTSVTSWSDESVRIAAQSTQAFAREIPPIAAPARPLGSDTPLSNSGTRFTGLIVRQSTRKAEEVIFSHGGAHFRLPVSQVSFSGKTMTLAAGQDPTRFVPDATVHDRLHHALSTDPNLMPDDKSHVDVEVVDGVAFLRGNVRVHGTAQYIAARAAGTPGVASVVNQIRNDFEIEKEAGLALQAAGLHQTSPVALRSSLGDVQLFGTAHSQRVAEDIKRTVLRVPGVRNVVSRLRIASSAAATA
jgi:osmotically-inducible protein OsmY